MLVHTMYITSSVSCMWYEKVDLEALMDLHVLSIPEC
jgi:hypothetical protein